MTAHRVFNSAKLLSPRNRVPYGSEDFQRHSVCRPPQLRIVVTRKNKAVNRASGLTRFLGASLRCQNFDVFTV
jgi:hypothetical protein